MMKKQLIAVLVGGLFLFVWQFLSWSMLGIHDNEMTHTDKQDVLLEALKAANLEEGTYFLPRTAPDATPADEAAYRESAIGNPWAIVQYRKSMSGNMAMNMIRGFITDLIAVFLLVWLLGKFTTVDLKTGIIASLAIGAIGFLTITYTGSVWFENPVWGHIIDTIISWGVVGAWLGYYLKT